MTEERRGPSPEGEGPGAAQASIPPERDEKLPDLGFSIQGVGVQPHAAVPTLKFDLQVDAGDASIRSLSLNVLVRIVATQRPYESDEKDRLFELFGAPRDWGRNLGSLVWAQTSFVIPPFDGVLRTDLTVPCSYDFDVAAHKYLHALRDGWIPLEFLFSGSVFYRGPGGALRTVRLSWEKDCRFDMPTATWHEVMDRYFPNSAWLRVRRDAFDRLLAFRASQGYPTWEAALDALLPETGNGSGGGGS